MTKHKKLTLTEWIAIVTLILILGSSAVGLASQFFTTNENFSSHVVEFKEHDVKSKTELKNISKQIEDLKQIQLNTRDNVIRIIQRNTRSKPLENYDR